jgi:hypothetical protein
VFASPLDVSIAKSLNGYGYALEGREQSGTDESDQMFKEEEKSKMRNCKVTRQLSERLLTTYDVCLVMVGLTRDDMVTLPHHVPDLCAW